MADPIKLPPGATLVDDAPQQDAPMKLPPGAQMVTDDATPPTPPSVWDRMKSNFNSNTQHTTNTGPAALLQNFGAGGADFIRGAYQAVTNPKSLLPHATTAKELMEAVGDDPKKILDTLTSDLPNRYASDAGNLAAGAIAGEAGVGVLKGGLKTLKGVREGVPKVTRPMFEHLTDTTPRATSAAVRDASADNVTAGQKHMEVTQDALHETEGRELKYRQDVKAATEEAQRKTAELDRAHDEAVQRALQETREKEDLYKADLAKAKAEGEAQYQKKLVEVQEKRAKAEQARRQEMRKYIADRNQIINDRKAAEAKFATERGKQAKIPATQTKLQREVGNLQAEIETARKNALAEGNSKYNAVNKKLNPIGANPNFFQDSLVEAAEGIKGSKPEPSVLKQMEKRIETGDPIRYEDLQADYSALGRELSKGTLDGPTYHAYDQMHEAIGNEMQRIADANGEPIDTSKVPRKIVDGKVTKDPIYKTDTGKQLYDSRAYWRRMKQAFGKPYTPTDAASKALRKSASGVMADAEQANRIRMLGSFDERLPGQFAHVANIEKGADALPNEASTGDLAAKAKPPAIPPRKPILPKVGEIPNPEPPPPAESVVPQPTRAEVPDRPKPVEPTLPAPPERVPHPDRPQEKTLSPESLSALKKENLLKSTDQLRHSKSPLVSAVAGYGTIKALLARNLLTAGLDITARVLYGAAKPTLANLLENPKVVAELTRFTERDAAAIAKLPAEQRAAFVGDFAPVVDAAKAKGIKISPALVGILAAGQSNNQPKGIAAALTPPTSSQ